MSLTHQELGSMTLQRLAYILPMTLEEETMVKEVFDQRASTSSYQTLTTIDVKQGWQEAILQKYVNEKRETMAIENPASLTPEEESYLDASVITKEKEMELQETLDKRNAKRKGIQKAPEEIIEVTSTPQIDIITEPMSSTEIRETISLDEVTFTPEIADNKSLSEEEPVKEVKKVSKNKK